MQKAKTSRKFSAYGHREEKVAQKTPVQTMIFSSCSQAIAAAGFLRQLFS